MSDIPPSPEGWGSHKNATRFRNYVRSVVLSVLAEELPGMKFGTVQSIDRDAGTCQIIYQGDVDSTQVMMFALQPSAIGQAVIIDGPRKRRFISQILGQTYIPGAAMTGWLQVSDAPMGRYNGFGAEIGSRIYFGGGNDTAESDTSVVSFDVDLRSWSVEAELPVGRNLANADAIGTDIYVVGGVEDGLGVIDTIFKYDTVANVWDDGLSLMPGAKALAGVAAHETDVYVFGGLEVIVPGYVSSPNTFKYDTLTDTWSTVAALPEDLYEVHARTVGDVIYVFGQDEAASINRLYAYDPVGNAFTELAAFPDLLLRPAVTLLGGRLAVLGGMDMLTYAASTKAYLYDPPSNSWSAIQDVPAAASAASAGQASGKLVFSGGIVDPAIFAPLSSTFVYTPA